MLLLLSLLLGMHRSFAQEKNDTINIDFGAAATVSPAGWNNVTNAKTGTIENLVNTKQLSTGISIAVTRPFNTFNPNGLVADDTLGIPANASKDSFYGNTTRFNGAVVPSSEVSLSNLHLETAYSFTFFASRGNVTDNRETQYLVEGETTVVVKLNASKNTSKVVRTIPVIPKEDGTIKITVEKGSNNNNNNNNNATVFFYLGAMKIAYVNKVAPGPKAITLQSPNGEEQLKAGKVTSI